jgi:hypothetical protein
VVTRVLGITDADRAGWQRLAANRLIAILDEHRNLPRVAWTVATAGSTLVGRIGRGDPAGVTRHTFDSWCAALAVDERAETPNNASAYLSAAVHIGGVKVTLTAVVGLGDDEPQGVAS